MPDARNATRRFELHNATVVIGVADGEVTLHVTVGPTADDREPVCVVLVTYQVDVGTPNVVGIVEAWDDDGRTVVLSGVPSVIAEWVGDSSEVTAAAEDAWADHVQSCRDYAIESGYCDARGM